MITLEFRGPVSAARAALFDTAVARWNSALSVDFPPLEVEGRVIDGVFIDAAITSIDGPGGVLGRAGPTILRPDNGLPLLGVIEFDEGDVARLEAQMSFADVVLHEIAHVLGFGTLWQRQGLVAGSGSANPLFLGPRARREYAILTGGPDVAGVPIANTGGPGTREGHWRELIFGNELLTGFLSGVDRPLSRLSIAAFEDMGYAVDYSAADSYDLPSFRSLAEMGILEAVRICDLCRMGRPEPVVLGQD